MKPRTKLQKQIFSLSLQLPDLAKDLHIWTFENYIQHIGYRTKKATSCLSCGHVWGSEKSGRYDTCPACRRKLKVETTLKKKRFQKVWFAVIDTKEGFQVNRFFEASCYQRAGEKPHFHMWEIIQQWLQPGGSCGVIARCRGGMGWYQEHFSGALEIRAAASRGGEYSLHPKYNLYPDKIYPKVRYLPIYRRNGFRGKFGGVTPYDMFTGILTDSKAETLLKARQMSLLAVRMSGNRYSVENYWGSIKICLRNNYKVRDATMWFDYLRLLKHFGKDLRSVKYVCPGDLKRAHDRLAAKKNDRERKQELEKRKLRIAAEQAKYNENKGMFFGIMFSDKNLTVRVIERIEDFMEEGNVHKHCVYASGYYKEDDSLILSARVNRKRVETVEVSLSKLRVIQARGFDNKASEYHRRILNLVRKNMGVIQKRLIETKTKVA